MKKGMMKYLVVALALVFALGSASAQLKPGDEVKDFSLKDVNGKAQKLSTLLQGKDVKGAWLTVWDVGCPYCQSDLPKMAKIYAGLKGKGLKWIGVAINTSTGKATEFADKHGLARLKFINLVDPDKKVSSAVKTKATPYILLVDKNRKVVAVYSGTSEAILAAVKKDAVEFIAKGKVTSAPVGAGMG